MYGVPKDLNLASVVGERLDSVSIEEFQTTFVFDDKTVICVEGAVDVEHDGALAAKWTQRDRWSSVEFQRCVGAVVQSFSVPTGEELRIVLSGGWCLRFFDTSPAFESFHIYPHEIHV